MQTKNLPQFTKSIKDRTVTGIFSVFGNCDSYNDVVLGGSFSKSISERGTKIPHLWCHDQHLPAVAVITSLREVGRNDLPDDAKAAFPDATGGAEVTREYLDTALGNEILTNLKAGVPLQMSYGFDSIQASFEQRDGTRVRLLKEQKLWETSDCIFGANSATSASKSLAAPSATKLRRALQSIKAMDGMDSMDMWSECYDVYGACSAMQAIVMLMSDEMDDPAQMAQLDGACRLLLAFITAELDECTAMLSAPMDAGMQMASRILSSTKMLLKVGKRNASADQSNLNAIHDMTVELGADNCPGTTSGDKSRADPPEGASLTQLKAKLAYLDFAIKE